MQTAGLDAGPAGAEEMKNLFVRGERLLLLAGTLFLLSAVVEAAASSPRLTFAGPSTIEAPRGARSIDFLPGDGILLVDRVQVHEAATGRRTGSFNVRVVDTVGMTFSADGSFAAAIAYSPARSYVVFDARTGLVHRRCATPASRPRLPVAVSPDGLRILTSDPPGVALWDLPGYGPARKIRELRGADQVCAFAFTPQNDQVVILDRVEGACAFDSRTGRQIWTRSGAAPVPLRTARIIMDGQAAVGLCGPSTEVGGHVRFIDLRTGNASTVQALAPSRAGVGRSTPASDRSREQVDTTVLVDAARTLVALVTEHGAIRVLDASRRALVGSHQLDVSRGRPHAVRLSPDGRYLAVGLPDRVVVFELGGR